MTRNKLDHLFKEKLERAEVQPSQAAFEKFQGQISGNKKSSYGWFYIAASVSLVIGLSAWLFFTGQSTDQTLATADQVETVDQLETINQDESDIAVNHQSETEAKIEEPSIEVPVAVADQVAQERETEIDDQDEPVDVINTGEVQVQVEPVLVAEVEESNLEAAPAEEDPLVLEVSEPIAANVTPPLEEEVKTLPKVKITYISGSKKKSQLAAAPMASDSSNVKDGTINRILHSARELTKGSLIADLRDVKDNFFNKTND